MISDLEHALKLANTQAGAMAERLHGLQREVWFAHNESTCGPLDASKLGPLVELHALLSEVLGEHVPSRALESGTDESVRSAGRPAGRTCGRSTHNRTSPRKNPGTL